MKSLKLCNYEILNFEAEPLIYSSKGITKVANPSLVSALNKLSKVNQKNISYDILKRILEEEKLCTESAIRHLKEIEVLGEPQPPTYFEKAVIYCDHEISTFTNKCQILKPQDKIEFKAQPQNIPLKTTTPTLVILASLKLNPQTLRKTYYHLIQSNPNGGICVGFICGHYFHLTEPYIPSIKNPCAFCTIDRIISYESLRASHHHWSKLLFFCNSRNIDLPTTKIDEWQNTLIIGQLIRLARKFTTNQEIKITQDRTLQSLTLNLETGSITEEASVHWSMCKCLEVNP